MTLNDAMGPCLLGHWSKLQKRMTIVCEDKDGDEGCMVEDMLVGSTEGLEGAI